jgi:hypothetical protein
MHKHRCGRALHSVNHATTCHVVGESEKSAHFTSLICWYQGNFRAIVNQNIKVMLSMEQERLKKLPGLTDVAVLSTSEPQPCERCGSENR